MKWIPLALAGCLVLTGCCTTPDPITIVETVEVKVPVRVECPVEMPRRAAYAAEALTAESTDFDKIRALLVERRQRDTAEEELRALLAVCLN